MFNKSRRLFLSGAASLISTAALAAISGTLTPQIGGGIDNNFDGGIIGAKGGTPSPILRNFYISSTGSDAAAGTQAAPWQTIAKVNSQTMLPGDCFNFKGGDTFTDATIAPSANGTNLNNIFFKSYGTGSATIAPTGILDGLDVLNKSYITWDGINFVGTSTTGAPIYLSASAASQTNLTIKNFTASGFADAGNGGIFIAGDSGTFGWTNVLIQNFIVSGMGNGGILAYSAAAAGIKVHSNITYQNGIIHDCGKNGAYIGACSIGLISNVTAYSNGATSTTGPVGLWTYWSDSVAIRFCESYNNLSANTTDGDGFDIDGGCTNCRIEYCYAHGNKGSGFLLWNDGNNLVWNNNTVRFCIGENNNSQAATFYGELTIGKTGTVSCLNANVYNNTFYNSSSGTAIVSLNDAAITGRVANNIFYSAGASVLGKATGNPSGLLFTGNDWFASGTFSINWNSVAYTTYATWQTATGQEKISGSNVGLNVDPLLISPGGGGTVGGYSTTQPIAYKLQASSTMLGAGLNLSSLFGISPGTQNYFSDPIPHGGLYDIGAGGIGTMPVAITATKTDNAEDATSQTTYTWSNRNFAIGAADATRLVVVGITSRVVGTASTINSVTIGGIAATKVAESRNTSASNLTTTSVWQALVPTGTTATVSATFSSAMLRAGCVVYSVIGSNGIVPAGANAANFSGVSTGFVATGTISVPVGGTALVFGSLSTVTGTPTITPTNYATDLGATLIGGTLWHTSGKDATAGSRSYTMTWGGTTPATPTGVFAAWGP